MQRLKVKGQRQAHCANNNQQKAGVNISISKQISHQEKIIQYGQQYLIIKSVTPHKNTTVLKADGLNTIISKCMRQLLTQLLIETNESIIPVISTLQSVLDRTSWQKGSKDNVQLNIIINHLYLADIYRLFPFHPTTT